MGAVIVASFMVLLICIIFSGTSRTEVYTCFYCGTEMYRIKEQHLLGDELYYCPKCGHKVPVKE